MLKVADGRCHNKVSSFKASPDLAFLDGRPTPYGIARDPFYMSRRSRQRSDTNTLALALFPLLLKPFGWKHQIWRIKSHAIRVLGGSCRRLIAYPESLWRAHVQVGSGRRGITVPSGSRVGKNVKM